MKVYVNLHPDYDYSSIIIQSGYIYELKDYVKEVDWLRWDRQSIKNKYIIQVFGKTNHIERTKVVLQRLLERGAEIEIRNKRSDEWKEYIPNKRFSKQEMICIEQQQDSKPDKLRWTEESYERQKNFTEKMIERGRNSLELQEILINELEDLIAEKEKNLAHLERIAKIWD